MSKFKDEPQLLSVAENLVNAMNLGLSPMLVVAMMCPDCMKKIDAFLVRKRELERKSRQP